MKQNEMGFSLFELLVVIAIIAILSAIAVPNFITWRDSANLRGSAFNLKSDLELAKMRAIRGGGNVVVKFSSTTPGYQIFQDNPTTGTPYTKDAGEPLILSRDLGGIGVSTTLDGNSTAFTSRGLALKTGSVTLTFKGQSIVLTINKLALVTM